MKAGLVTKILSPIVTSSVVPVAGFPAVNVMTDDTLQLWKVIQGTVTLLVTFTPAAVQAICLFNCNVEHDITITCYSAYPGVVHETLTLDHADLCGFESRNVLFELVDTATPIEAIKIVTNGGTPTFQTYAGYLWAGDFIDFGCAENIQPSDESKDEVTVTRANAPDSKDVFKKQSYAITIKKENDFNDLRDDIREILTAGYGVPRPWIINEPFLDDHEVFLGIMDSGKVKYDVIKTSTEFISQATIGLLEVF